MPLARVQDLLCADQKEFAAAVAEIDARERHRERIARLAAGDSLALPPEGAAYLDRWRELGISERIVEIERDSWILALAVLSPEQVAEVMALKGRLLDDPEFVGTMRSIGETGGWAPDDPRLPGLADQVAAMLDRHAAWSGGSASEMEAGLVDLFDSIALDSLPVGRRLEERGRSGWTRQERVGG